jgi:hypothetical protein
MKSKKFFALAMFLVLFSASQSLKAQSYAFEELKSEDTAAKSPFSITKVVPINSGLRIYVSTDDPETIANLLTTGALLTQLSDHIAGTETPVPISFGKAVRCTIEDDPVYLAYKDPLPGCDGQPPAIVEYFFDAAAVLGPGRDLALGKDPDFLWLIEEE